MVTKQNEVNEAPKEQLFNDHDHAIVNVMQPQPQQASQ